MSKRPSWDRVSPGPPGKTRLSRRKRRNDLLEFLVISLVAFALVFGIIRPFVLEAFHIPSESMVPTLEIGDRVFVNKLAYRASEPERGDIVVFESVDDGNEALIKRVVGLPGDTIAVQSGTLYVNGEPRKEPYLNRQRPDESFFGPITVAPGHVFVMGDNRANSADSRVFGSVPKEKIKGEAFLRYWPPERAGLL